MCSWDDPWCNEGHNERELVTEDGVYVVTIMQPTAEGWASSVTWACGEYACFGILGVLTENTNTIIS